MIWSKNDAYQIINRCTRDGHVLWQHVAQQMGMSIDSVRSQFDPNYRQADLPRVSPSAVVVRPPALARPPSIGPLAQRVLDTLRNGPLPVAAIVEATGVTPNSVYGRLSDLLQVGLIKHNHELPRVWRVVEAEPVEKVA